MFPIGRTCSRVFWSSVISSLQLLPLLGFHILCIQTKSCFFAGKKQGSSDQDRVWNCTPCHSCPAPVDEYKTEWRGSTEVTFRVRVCATYVLVCPSCGLFSTIFCFFSIGHLAKSCARPCQNTAQLRNTKDLPASCSSLVVPKSTSLWPSQHPSTLHRQINSHLSPSEFQNFFAVSPTTLNWFFGKFCKIGKTFSSVYKTDSLLKIVPANCYMFSQVESGSHPVLNFSVLKSHRHNRKMRGRRDGCTSHLLARLTFGKSQIWAALDCWQFQCESHSTHL